MRKLSLGVVVLVSWGCVTSETQTEVGLSLSEVERPDDVEERWGQYILEPADSAGYTYEDDLISLAVVPAAGTFSTVVENRSQHSIRLLWAEGAYVDPDGVASGIVPGDTRWIDMGDPPSPQTIPSSASAAAVVIPRANANVSAQNIEGFVSDDARCEDVEDIRLRLVLPIEIQGTVNEYTLRFEAEEAARVTYEVNEFDGTSTEQHRSPC